MNNEIPFGFDPGSTHFPQQHLGPQLTEYTGNRIATALERIADALERQAATSALTKEQYLAAVDRAIHCLDHRIPTPYPLGDPAPIVVGPGYDLGPIPDTLYKVT